MSGNKFRANYYPKDKIIASELRMDKNLLLLVCEGKTDVTIYKRLVQYIQRENKGEDKYNITVRSVETNTATGGCTKVIKTIETVNQCGTRYQARLLGIIDGDAKAYRQTPQQQLPSNILQLKYYSIESYFVSQARVKSIINNLTRSHNCDIPPENQENINHIAETAFGVISNKYYQQWYYFALNALHNEIKPINYEHKDREQKFSDLNQQQLDLYARQLAITYSIDNIKKIANGKWLSAWFHVAISNYINEHEAQRLVNTKDNKIDLTKLRLTNDEIATDYIEITTGIKDHFSTIN